MILRESELSGAWIVEAEPRVDERGCFARMFCAEAFAGHGLETAIDQISLSFNARAGTLRGLHLQRPPHAEAKLVRVTAGAIFDVAVDLRAGSSTFGGWIGVELSAENRRQLYIPAGFAHGFQTLTDATEIAYHISGPYQPDAQDGVVWNDPELAIGWPDPTGAVLSERDRGLKRLTDFRPIQC